MSATISTDGKNPKDEKPPRRGDAPTPHGQFIRGIRPKGDTRHTGSAPPARRKVKPGVFRRRACRASETGMRAVAFRGQQNALILLVDRMRYCRMQPRLSLGALRMERKSLLRMRRSRCVGRRSWWFGCATTCRQPSGFPGSPHRSGLSKSVTLRTECSLRCR